MERYDSQMNTEDRAFVWMMIFFFFFALVALFVQDEEKRRQIENNALTKWGR